MVIQLLSCLTLCDPMDCSPSGPLSMGFPRQEYWSGLPFLPPGDLPDPGIEPKGQYGKVEVSSVGPVSSPHAALPHTPLSSSPGEKHWRWEEKLPERVGNPKLRGHALHFPWESGSWETASLCPQQHGKASGEKKQRRGETRQREELRQRPQDQNVAA